MNVMYICSEVNGFLLCFKMGKVPIETQSFSHLAVPGVSTPTRYLLKLYCRETVTYPSMLIVSYYILQPFKEMC